MPCIRFSMLRLALFASAPQSVFALVHQRHQQRGPLDTAPESTFEGPDMIPIWPPDHVPPPLPNAWEAGDAKKDQIRIDRDLCHLDFPRGNVYLVTQPEIKPYLLNNTRSPAVLVLPGGGNRFLAWEREGTNVAEWLNSLGVAAFVLKYRVPSRDFFEIIDTQRAMSFIRSRAGEFGVDPLRVGVIGFSAGGGQVAMLSTSVRHAYPKVDSVDALDYHPDFAFHMYGTGTVYEDVPAKMLPPTFSVSALDDPCVKAETATAYCDALKAKGGECERHVYPNGGHGYGTCQVFNNSWSGTSVCDWTREAKSWLQRQGIISS